MIEGLERFVTDLRAVGIAVSAGDFIVALRAVEAVGLEDRGRLRAALACTLVKRSEDRPSFAEVFARHFASHRAGGRATDSRREGRQGSSLHRARQPSEGGRRPEPGAPRSVGRAAFAKPKTAAQLAFEVLRSRGRGPMRLSRVIGRSTEADLLPRAAAQRSAREAARATRSPLLLRPALEDERALARQIPRLLCQLRLGAGRRLRRSRRGELWLRRVFRENLSHEGVPWCLPRRRIEPRRPRLVLLLDVSWSTALATGLFLCIAVELLGRFRRTRVLFFVDRVVDGTAEVERWLRGSAPNAARGPSAAGRRRRAPPGAGLERGGVSFAQLLESLSGLSLESPSDYGRAFCALARSARRPTGRTTALVVLGDGRNNHIDPQAWAFEEIAERCGVVLWLVPEPAELWGSGDSALDAYLPHVDVAVEARDPQGLARGVAELARRL